MVDCMSARPATAAVSALTIRGPSEIANRIRDLPQQFALTIGEPALGANQQRGWQRD